LAILPVIFSHCYPYGCQWVSTIGEIGWIGVDLFFVLSGYLITGILLDTVKSAHYYRNFICRRALRIFPLYYCCLTVFGIAAVLSSQWPALQKWGGVEWFVVYLGNIRAAWTGTHPPIFLLAPLWSLQVEEQFYLLYPAMVLFLSRTNLRRALIGCAIAAPLLRFLIAVLMPNSGEARYVLTPCRMDSLAVGGLVALLVRSPKPRFTVRQVVTVTICAGLAFVAILAVAGPSWESALMSVAGYSILAVISASILIVVVFWPKTSFAAALRWKPLAYTGQIAYGLYLLHGPASGLARSVTSRLCGIRINGHSAPSVPITFAASYIAAGLSWRFFETPILRLKSRFTR
jgi:peptidoglycan/LPS O-acetylase OafA/YrhL